MRKQYSAEEKIAVLEGQRGEDSIAELRRREGIATEPVLSLVEGLPEGGRYRANPGTKRGGGIAETLTDKARGASAWPAQYETFCGRWSIWRDERKQPYSFSPV